MTLTCAEMRTGLTEPLARRGFERIRTRNLWFEKRDGFGLGVGLVRRGTEIETVISSVEVGEIMCGVQPDGIHDTRYAAFIVRSFWRPGSVTEQAVDAADWLWQFRDVDDVLDVLASEPREKLGLAGMGGYVNWGYRIFAAAALAVTTRNPRASVLAEQALSWTGNVDPGRRDRLLTAMA